MALKFKDITTNELRYANSDDSPIYALKQQNADILLDNILKEAQLQSVKQSQADLIIQLVEKGIL